MKADLIKEPPGVAASGGLREKHMPTPDIITTQTQTCKGNMCPALCALLEENTLLLAVLKKVIKGAT